MNNDADFLTPELMLRLIFVHYDLIYIHISNHWAFICLYLLCAGLRAFNTVFGMVEVKWEMFGPETSLLGSSFTGMCSVSIVRQLAKGVFFSCNHS